MSASNTENSDARRPRFSFSRFSRLARKELRESLRDRRTILTLVLMPLLVYPLLAVVMQKFLLGSLLDQTRIELQLAFTSERDAVEFSMLMERGGVLADIAADNEAIETPAPQTNDTKNEAESSLEQMVLPAPELSLRFGMPEDDPSPERLRALVQSGEIALAVLRRTGDDGESQWQLIADDGSNLSLTALGEVRRRLKAINDDHLRRLVDEAGLSRDVPAEFQVERLASIDAATFSLKTFFPLMLILMTVTGAVYPAIDLTAGERERGTLEALIAAPVSRFQLLLAKFVAVLTVALLTAMVNLIAMLLTVTLTGLSPLVFGAEGVSLGLVAALLAMLCVFAAFFSAALLGLTSLARSFKEAQAYLIPLMLLSLAPGILSLLPDLELTALWAMVPLANMVLLGRDVLANDIQTVPMAIAIGSTLLYAVLALSLAARVFGADSILYGSTGTWQELFTRRTVPEYGPSLKAGLFALAAVTVAFLLLSNASSLFGEIEITMRLLVNGAVLALVFVGIPFAVAGWDRTRIRSSFRLHSPAPLAWITAAVWGLSLWVFAFELRVLTLDVEQLERLTQIAEQFGLTGLAKVSLPITLLTLAVAPGICEELFFRGYLMKALREEFSPVATIVLTSVLFGLFHVLTGGTPSFERLLPTTFLGIFLGTLAMISGSVLPGMLLHILSNGLLLTIANRQEALQSLGIGTEEVTHLPGWLIGTAAVLVLIGGGLLTKIGLGTPTEPPPPRTFNSPGG